MGLLKSRQAKALDARDNAFHDYVNAAGGFEPRVELIQLHAAQAGLEVAYDEALTVIEGGRHHGIVRHMSIGEYLDEYVAAARPSSGEPASELVVTSRLDLCPACQEASIAPMLAKPGPTGRVRSEPS